MKQSKGLRNGVKHGIKPQNQVKEPKDALKQPMLCQNYVKSFIPSILYDRMITSCAILKGEGRANTEAGDSRYAA